MQKLLSDKGSKVSLFSWVIAAGIGILVLLLGYFYLPTMFYQNLGWRYFAASKYQMHDALLAKAGQNFARALVWDSQNTSAWRGQALVAASRQELDIVQPSWQQADRLPAAILDYGRLFQRQGDLPAALHTYEAAISFYADAENPARFAATTVCQRTWSDLLTYSPDFQAFCRRAYAENEQNHLFNAQFTAGVDAAWLGQFFYARPGREELFLDDASGQPAPSIALVGKTDEPHFGLYQIVCLPPGSTVRFNGWFRIEASGKMSARLLYIGWRQNDSPQGNQAQVVENDLGWTFFERTFTLPAEALSRVDFYPVVFSGKGTVWVDHLRVELLSQPSISSTTERICL